MSNIIKNKTYFFLTKSVFEEAAKSFSNSSFKFLQKSVMIKLLHRDKINPHLVFYFQEGVESIKTEFGNRFESIFQIGENMFASGFNPRIQGNINDRVLAYATDINGEIPKEDKVKIVCGNNSTSLIFGEKIKTQHYPIEHIKIDDALKELEEIEKQFNVGKTYYDAE